MGRVVDSYYSSGLIKPDEMPCLIPCGTKFHAVLMSAGDVDTYGASDQAGCGMRHADRMRRGPLINKNTRGISKAL